MLSGWSGSQGWTDGMKEEEADDQLGTASYCKNCTATAPQNCTASYRSAPFKDGDTSGLRSLLWEVAGGGGVRGAESALAVSRSTSSFGIRKMWTWFPP